MTSTPTTTQVDLSHMTRDELVGLRRHLIAVLRIIDMLLGHEPMPSKPRLLPRDIPSSTPTS